MYYSLRGGEVYYPEGSATLPAHGLMIWISWAVKRRAPVWVPCIVRPLLRKGFRFRGSVYPKGLGFRTPFFEDQEPIMHASGPLLDLEVWVCFDGASSGRGITGREAAILLV